MSEHHQHEETVCGPHQGETHEHDRQQSSQDSGTGNIDQSLISVIRYKPIIFQDLEKRRKKICEKMGKKYVPLKRTYKKRASKPKKKKSEDTSGNTPF